MAENTTLSVLYASSRMSTAPNDNANLCLPIYQSSSRYTLCSKQSEKKHQVGEKYQHNKVQECIFRIDAKFFGNNYAGSSASIHLCHQIREMKVSLHLSICEYEELFHDYHKYLSFCPWVSGENLGKKKLPYNKQELNEILQTLILHVQYIKLNGHNQQSL